MTKDFLSQEEIDALLRQDSVETANTEEELSEFDRDALGEIGNISFGTAATALSTLLRHKVEITTPTVSVVKRDDLSNDMPFPHVVIKVDYADGFVGSNVLAIKVSDAQVIADLMLGGDGNVEPGELNELHLSAVAEAMNQMMGSAATSMSTIFSMAVNITPPNVEVLDLAEEHASNLFPDEETLVKISFRLLVEGLIDSSIMHLVPFSFAKTILAKLTGKNQAEQAPQAPDTPVPPMSQEPAPAAAQPSASAPQQPVNGLGQAPGMAPHNMPVDGYGMPAPGYAPVPQGMPGGYGVPQPGYGAGYAGGYGMPQPGYGAPMSGYAAAPVNVQPAQFASFGTPDAAIASNPNLNLLLDIPLQVTVELGRTRKQIREILELGPGSILELDKLAGEPVDILVNNKLIAKGEVVVIDENFGVRVTDILSQAERINKLQ